MGRNCQRAVCVTRAHQNRVNGTVCCRAIHSRYAYIDYTSSFEPICGGIELHTLASAAIQLQVKQACLLDTLYFLLNRAVRYWASTNTGAVSRMGRLLK
jgi:hypothetical protein